MTFQERSLAAVADWDFPAKVTVTALQNAASLAALLLTTECLVTDKPEKKGGAGGGEMDDMDY